jgi:hypothetical protein
MKTISVMSLVFLMVFLIGCGETNSKAPIIIEDNTTIPDTNGTDTNDSTDVNDTDDTYIDAVNDSFEFVDVNFTTSKSTYNKAAYVTSQCYTKTVDENGKVHNPCMACHINSVIPNYVNDTDLQEARDFSIYSFKNHFINLFKDRRSLIEKISDENIVTYIREDNYKESNGTLKLANRLTNNLPSEWDRNKNGKWNGYMPDCYFNFDNEGFDMTPEGNYTGWRAFGYYPFLGTFWPTNGSTDDVLIRLHKDFQQNSKGEFDLEVYKLNLAIVEALIKEKDISLPTTVDETKYGVDLNQDGDISTSDVIVFPKRYVDTANLIDFPMSYVGKAKELLEAGNYHIAPALYPEYTEFLHTVRYVDFNETDKSITMAPRMKELRYAIKRQWFRYIDLKILVENEVWEKESHPGEVIRRINGSTETGTLNGQGWVFQGFIEDKEGELRPQNFEENMYCIGCHSGIGATTDSTFAFKRKFDGNVSLQDGWYHWKQKVDGFTNIPEPKLPNGDGEYETYLRVNGAGDEFRANDEVKEKFFETNGTLKISEIEKMRANISYLVNPSVERAIKLNKAYKIIVDEQSFIYGRDTLLQPVANTVHKEVTIGESTEIQPFTR